MENRIAVMIETLENGGGISYDLLCMDDLRRLHYHYGEKSLYIGMMGGQIALRLCKEVK